MPELHGKNLIAGQRHASNNGQIQAPAPAKGDTLPESFHVAEASEVDAAVKSAVEASKVLRHKSADELAGFIESIAERIEQLGDTLYERVMAETALPEGRVKGETARTTNQLRMFATLVREGSWVDARIDRADPDRQPAPKPDLRRMLIPIGPVAVFGASNFPMAFSTAGGDTASAFAAGNPVIVKAHPSHPGTCELVGEAITHAARDHDMPAGIFSLLHGGADVGTALVKHPGLAAVGFTGSARAGRALFDTATARPNPIPVYAEMGSVNPMVLLPDRVKRQPEQLAQDLAGSITLGVGQFCTQPGVIFAINEPATDQCVDALAKQLQEAGGVMLNESIHAGYQAGVEALKNTDGVRTLIEAANNDQPNKAGATLFEVDVDRLLANPDLAEENFGPSTLIVRCQSQAQLLDALQALPGQLTGTVYAEETDDMTAVVDVLRQKVGRLLFGGVPTGVEVTHAMQHGGPWPASSDVRSTSVGTAAGHRFARPVCYQNAPQTILPDALKDDNPMGLLRMVDGQYSRERIQ
jgi:NADP-dependent aldehyde dehydrogenase